MSKKINLIDQSVSIYVSIYTIYIIPFIYFNFNARTLIVNFREKVFVVTNKSIN